MYIFSQHSNLYVCVSVIVCMCTHITRQSVAPIHYKLKNEKKRKKKVYINEITVYQRPRAADRPLNARVEPLTIVMRFKVRARYSTVAYYLV